jgi:bifunctional non-homologous end joining protein LigD
MAKKKYEYFTYEVDGYIIESKHPDKLYWPEAGITKRDLMDYYNEMGDYMLTFLKKRPLTLHYFPYGIHKFSFYKRDFDINAPKELIEVYLYKEKSQDKVLRVPVVKNKAGLVYLGSRGCLEIHAWASRYPHFEQPDFVVFDMDASDEVPFDKIIQATRLLYKKLKELQLISYVKTSGGTGIHVYVPVKPGYTFDQVRSWAAQLSEKLAIDNPDLITTIKEQRKSHAGNKVVIDFMQNVITRNTAAPYTPRANPEARVSTPLQWKEIEKGGFTPSDFTMKTVPDRVKSIGDLFADILEHPQELPAL